MPVTTTAHTQECTVLYTPHTVSVPIKFKPYMNIMYKIANKHTFMACALYSPQQK